MRKLMAVGIILVAIFAVSALVVSTDVMAKGKPKPPPCGCAPTVNGCILVECGSFDCVYQCPFP